MPALSSIDATASAVGFVGVSDVLSSGAALSAVEAPAVEPSEDAADALAGVDVKFPAVDPALDVAVEVDAGVALVETPVDVGVAAEVTGVFVVAVVLPQAVGVGHLRGEVSPHTEWHSGNTHRLAATRRRCDSRARRDGTLLRFVRSIAPTSM
jgi:hypothetical protein